MGNSFTTTTASTPASASDPTQRTGKWIVTVPPTADTYPVTIADVQTHLRLPNTTGVAIILQGATDYAEDALSMALLPRTILATFYSGERLILPRGPLLEIVSIKDANDTSVTAYKIKHQGHTAEIIPDAGIIYPASITYRAGYATAADIPASIRLGILAHCGTHYENRESTSDKSKQAVPHSLADFYRLKSHNVGVG